MSDYIPKDPYTPNDPLGHDRTNRFEPMEDSGKGPYILLGLLVAIGLIGGLLYFNGTPTSDSVAQAPARPAIERTTPAPGAMPMPAKPAAPADTAAKAPTAPAPATQQQ